MKNKFLLPSLFYKIGGLLFILGSTLGILYLQNVRLSFFSTNGGAVQGIEQLFLRTSFQGDVALTLIIVGLYFLGFSRRAIEDEYIDFIRHQSLLISVLIQSFALIVASWLIGGITFFTVMMFNLFSLLAVYNLIFHLCIFRNQRQSSK
ncbi:MAG: hypothetical protein PSX81_13215 [bacterium]|nr:hypothetical protein [bacterium]